MLTVLTSRIDGYVQLITVLLIFVVVLGLTAYVTKWIAKYQKENVKCNIEVLETARITANKYLQVVRVGETYIVIAVCKDTVTMLCEVPKEQLGERTDSKMPGFQELLERAVKKDSGKSDEQKEP